AISGDAVETSIRLREQHGAAVGCPGERVEPAPAVHSAREFTRRSAGGRDHLERAAVRLSLERRGIGDRAAVRGYGERVDLSRFLQHRFAPRVDIETDDALLPGRVE